MTDIKKLIVWGDPTRMVEELYPQLDPDNNTDFVYIDRLGELVEEDVDWDEENVVNTLLYHTGHGATLYIGRCMPTSEERSILDKLIEKRPNVVIDEALELLKLQVGGTTDDPISFEDLYINSIDIEGGADRIHFDVSDDDNTLVFRANKRGARKHTISWMPDGSIEIDGCVLRSAALFGQGTYLTGLLGDTTQTSGLQGVLKPAQVAAFVARRMATNGPEDLLGYGRAFGPGKDDHTNATLTARSREFRSNGVVGVVLVTSSVVTKAKPDMVVEVARTLRKTNPHTPIFLHQQCKEIYVGDAALEAFRAEHTLDDKGRDIITMHGKSTKATRVDAGAYCLYTEDGTGYIDIPVVVGMFEESNGGGVFAPKQLMDDLLIGYLKENVVASRHDSNMSRELLTQYYATSVVVAIGDRVEPGDVLFDVDGVPHAWETKADYGFVRNVVDVAGANEVRVEIQIDAYFTGDGKLRGPFKAMTVPMEAAGLKYTVTRNNVQDVTPRFVVGAAGIIKDSAAAAEYITDIKPCWGSVTTKYCKRDFELAKQKHAPLEEKYDLLIREYDDVGITIVFNDSTLEVTTMDPNAFTAIARVMIEASPVGQSVGSSAMTLPQLAWLSSLPAGNEWLIEEALPGIIRRTRALAYMHAVASGTPMATSR